MSKRKRTLLAIAMLELMLAIGWWYLASMAAKSTGAAPDAQQVIGQTFGMAMGALLGLAPLLYLIARKNDQRDAAKRQVG